MGAIDTASAPTPSSRRKRQRYQNVADLDAAIDRLDTQGRAELLQRWSDLYSCAPPHKISRKLLVQSIAHRMQEAHHGALAPATRRRLLRLADDLRERGDAAITVMPRIKAGTRFVREWQGTLHQVTVTTSGFEWQGRSHRSLSEIARAITGTRWNGWTFFGARSSKRKRAGRALPAVPTGSGEPSTSHLVSSGTAGMKESCHA